MIINTCTKYNRNESKGYNNDKVAHGWQLTEVSWQKKDIVDLTTMHGISCNEYVGDHKVAKDWVATHAIMLDFDDGSMTVDDLLSIQKNWQYNSYVYNSQNHQKQKTDKDGNIVPACDRLRALIPLSEPIRSEIDRKAVEQALISHFKKSNKNLDASFLGKARYFAHGGIMISSFVGDKEAMNWRTMPGLKYRNKGRKKESEDFFRLNDHVKDKDGIELLVSDIDDKTIIYCPICGDAPYRSSGSHNAFIDINDDELPFIFCSSCQARSMGVNGKGIYNLHPDDAYRIKSNEYQTAVFIDVVQSDLSSIGIEPGHDGPIVRPIKNVFYAKQFCKANDLPVPDVYPRARLLHYFDKNDIINFDDGYVNKYVAPAVLKTDVPDGHNANLPQCIGRLIDHVLGHDEEIKNRFYNDIAHLVQQRKKLITSYLFQGTEGTGKGFLFNNVFRKIFGDRFCSETNMDAFNNRFNSFLVENVIVLVSEVSANFASSEKQGLSIIEKMKMAITDTYIQIEGKNKDRNNGENNCTFFFATNRHHGIVLSKDDRRFNVAPRQEVKLHDADWYPGYNELIRIVADELQEFVYFLKQYDVDDSLIGKVIDNEPKRLLQAFSTTDADDFFEAVNNGDVSWFRDNVIAKDNYNGGEKLMEINAIISKLSGSDKTSTGDLCQIYNYINNKNLPVHRFTKMAKQHLKVKIKQMRLGTGRIQGIEMKWNDEKDIYN